MTSILKAKPLWAVFFPLIVFSLFFFSVALKAQDVPPAPTQEYFESLGHVIKWLPQEGDEGYRPGQAKGAQIEFRRDFKKSESQDRWVVHKNELGCEGGETKCDTCDEGEVCSLWLPDKWEYFKVE
jgi:hypothetical protein